MIKVGAVLLTVFAAYGSVSNATAQTAYQHLVSDVGIGTEYTHRAFAYADGSTLVQQWSDTLGLLFTRFDASGDPLWRRVIELGDQAGGSPPMVATPDGGFLLAVARTTYFPSDSGLVDISKYTSTGASEWALSVVVADIFGSSVLGACAIDCNSAGDIFMANMIAGGGSYITKLSPTGVPFWSKHITDPDFGTGIDQLVQVEGLDDGGCVFLGSGWGDRFAVGRLDASGSPLWMESFRYDSPNAIFNNVRIVPDPDGQYIITSILSMLNVGPYSFVTKIDTNGVWVASDLYEYDLPYMLTLFRALQVSNGQLLLLGGYYDLVNGYCTRLDTNGQVISALQTRTVVTGTTVHRVLYLATDIANDSLHMASALLSRDTVFGTEDATATLWKSAPDMGGLCIMDPINVLHFPVPAGVVLSEDVGAVQNIGLPTIPFTVVNTTFPLPVTSSFCGLVAIAEDPQPPAFGIAPNPVAHGSSFSFSSITGGRVEVLDTQGRVVKSISVFPGFIALLAPSTPGLYPVRFTTGKGDFSTIKLVVE